MPLLHINQPTYRQYMARIEYNDATLIGPDQPRHSMIAKLTFYAVSRDQAIARAITRKDFPEAMLLSIEEVR